jgi:hypothetical protein
MARSKRERHEPLRDGAAFPTGRTWYARRIAMAPLDTILVMKRRLYC